MAEVNSEQGDKKDPVLDQFIELRKYIEHSHETLSDKVDGLETRMDKLEARVEKVEVRLETVDTRLGAVETRLGAVETRLQRVETGQLQLGTKFERLEQTVDAGFSDLGRKIDALASAGLAPGRRKA